MSKALASGLEVSSLGYSGVAAIPGWVAKQSMPLPCHNTISCLEPCKCMLVHEYYRIGKHGKKSAPFGNHNSSFHTHHKPLNATHASKNLSCRAAPRRIIECLNDTWSHMYAENHGNCIHELESNLLLTQSMQSSLLILPATFLTMIQRDIILDLDVQAIELAVQTAVITPVKRPH